MSIIIRSPETDEEFRRYYHLRWQLLRAPWGQAEGSEKDRLEEQSLHFIAVPGNLPNGGEIIAVARLQANTAEEAQIRYMAVAPGHRRRGIGRKLVTAIENSAIDCRHSRIVLDAREQALPFYRACGYTVETRTHRLFNTIQHFRMSKTLPGR